MARIIIVGGGITGCAAAYWLAMDGHETQLLESQSIAAMGSGWSLGGVRQSGRDPAELPLARAAVVLWPSLDERLGGKTEYRQRGNVRLARTEAEAETIRALVAGQRGLGLDLTYLATPADVRAVAPAIGERVLAASFCPTDGHANPTLSTQAFAAAAVRAGARIRDGVEVHALSVAKGRVTGVVTDDGPLGADVVIVAAGIRTPALLAPLGLALPLSVQLVSVVQSKSLPPIFDQVFGVANADCAGRQEADGRFRFTSGIGPWLGVPAAWREANLAPPAGEVARLRALVGAVLPAAGRAAVLRTWGGLIDLTPDALPVIDRPPDVEGLVVAAGFSGHGFGIGPVSGQLAADLAVGKPPRLDVSAFRLSRDSLGTDTSSPLSLHG